VKKCSRCKLNKSYEKFVKHSRTKDGYYVYCKICHQERKRENKYGISTKELNKIYKKQEYKCAICYTESKLVVDHCHSNGHVRGLLCSNCNTALGLLKDNPITLQVAIVYLEDR